MQTDSKIQVIFDISANLEDNFLQEPDNMCTFANGIENQVIFDISTNSKTDFLHIPNIMCTFANEFDSAPFFLCIEEVYYGGF